MESKIQLSTISLIVIVLFCVSQIDCGKKKEKGLIIVLSNGGCGGNIVVQTDKGGKKGSGGHKIVVKGGDSGGCGCSSSCSSCGGDHQHVQHVPVPVPIPPGHPIPHPHGDPHHMGDMHPAMMSQQVPAFAEAEPPSSSSNSDSHATGDSGDQESQASDNSVNNFDDSNRKSESSPSSDSSDSSSDSSSSTARDSKQSASQLMAPLFIPMNVMTPPWFHGSPVFMDPASQNHLSSTANQQQVPLGYSSPSPSTSYSSSSQAASSSSPSIDSQTNQGLSMDPATAAATAHFMAQAMGIPSYHGYHPHHYQGMEKGEFSESSHMTPMLHESIYYPQSGQLGQEFATSNGFQQATPIINHNNNNQQSNKAQSESIKKEANKQGVRGSRNSYLQPIISSVQKLIKAPGQIKFSDIEQGLVKQGQRMQASFSNLVPVAITNYTAYLPSLPGLRSSQATSNTNNNNIHNRKPGNRRSKYLESLRVRLRPVALTMDSTRMTPFIESLWKNIRGTRTGSTEGDSKPTTGYPNHNKQVQGDPRSVSPSQGSGQHPLLPGQPNDVVMQQYLEQIHSSKWWEWPSGGLLGPNLNQYAP